MMDDAYLRLLAARRIVTPEERELMDKADKAERQNARIRRKLAKVF